jgi:hypothetical protein
MTVFLSTPTRLFNLVIVGVNFSARRRSIMVRAPSKTLGVAIACDDTPHEWVAVSQSYEWVAVSQSSDCRAHKDPSIQIIERVCAVYGFSTY